MFRPKTYLALLTVVFCTMIRFGYGQETCDIHHLYVNNFTNIACYGWQGDSIFSKVVYTASDSFSIISFDITDDEKYIALSEGAPFLYLGDRALDPQEEYYGIGRTNLVLVFRETGKKTIIDTIGGTYGEGARWVAQVGLAPHDKYFFALIGGGEWNSLYFYSVKETKELERLPDIPILGDGVVPICWSGNDNILYAYNFHYGDPEYEKGYVMSFDLPELQSQALKVPLDSLVLTHVLLSQGVGPTEKQIESHVKVSGYQMVNRLSNWCQEE